MKKSIPMTGSSAIVTDPDLEKFRATIARLWQQAIDSGKVKLPADSPFVRGKLNIISAPADPAPAPVKTAPPPRRGPPPRPPFKRPTAMK